jgi:hypothetical protein
VQRILQRLSTTVRWGARIYLGQGGEWAAITAQPGQVGRFTSSRRTNSLDRQVQRSNKHGLDSNELDCLTGCFRRTSHVQKLVLQQIPGCCREPCPLRHCREDLGAGWTSSAMELLTSP